MTEAQLFAARRGLRPISDPLLRRSLVRLFAKVYRNADEYDLIILTARRLSCLYLALVESGVDPIPGRVVTDRVLDTIDPETLIGARVLIVDDSIIGGSTLAYLVRTVKNMVLSAGSVHVWSACLDTDQIDPGLRRYVRPIAAVEAPSDVVRRFSGDIAKVLFQSTTPYFSDFLVTRRVKLDMQALQNILQPSGWSVADVTSPLVAGKDDASYTFLPKPETMNAIRERLHAISPSTESALLVAKVRLFVKAEGLEASVRFVPMALSRAISSDEADAMLHELCLAFGISKEVRVVSVYWTLQAKHRHIQLLASLLVLSELWKSLPTADLDSCIGSELLAGAALDLNFGKFFAQAVCDAIDNLDRSRLKNSMSSFRKSEHRFVEQAVDGSLKAVIYERVQAARRFSNVFGAPAKPGKNELIYLGQVDVAPIAELFWFIDQLTLMHQGSLPDHATAQEFFERYPSPESRFGSQGLTMQELSSAYSWSDDDPDWAASVCSLAVDVCNDTGVAVPITRLNSDGDVSVRTYRTGENSHVGGSSGVSSKFLPDETFLSPLYLLRRIYTTVAPLNGGFASNIEEDARALERYREEARVAFGESDHSASQILVK